MCQRSRRDAHTVDLLLGLILKLKKALRRKNLLKFFGSVAKMKKASAVELAKAPGMNAKLAQEVFDYLKGA